MPLIHKDLTEIFFDPSIINEECFDAVFIDPQGEPEAGKGKGVVLDMIAHFWNECFISLTVCRKAKTPLICHDMQKREGEAVVCILVYACEKYNHFPIQLSSLFITLCLFGEGSISSEFLLAS